MFASLEQQIIALAQVVPLPGFVFVASFIEEVVAPIPSPLVMLVAGALAKAQELGLGDMGLLILIATIGKTMGALCVYGIASTAEDIIVKRFPRFFGITRSDVEALRTKLSGTARDYLILTLLRALPIVPSVLVSAGGGLLKLPLRLFITTTLLGTVIRDGLYLYAGYVGTQTLVRIVDASARIEDYVLVFAAIVVLMLGIRYIHTRRRSSISESEG